MRLTELLDIDVNSKNSHHKLNNNSINSGCFYETSLSHLLPSNVFLSFFTVFQPQLRNYR